MAGDDIGVFIFPDVVVGVVGPLILALDGLAVLRRRPFHHAVSWLGRSQRPKLTTNVNGRKPGCQPRAGHDAARGESGEAHPDGEPSPVRAMPHPPDAKAQVSFMMERTLHYGNRSAAVPAFPCRGVWPARDASNGRPERPSRLGGRVRQAIWRRSLP